MTTTVREVTGTLTKAGPGRVMLRIIDEGVGSSGIYSAETLQRAAKEKAFSKGTQIHLDHDTEMDMMERPEGSLRNLVGVLTEDAHYKDGALMAEARIGSPWRHLIDEFGEYIGVSISAQAEVQDTSEGRVVERLVPHPFNRTDLVTRAGRGGRIEAVLEAARLAQEQESRPDPAGKVNTDSKETDMSETNITEALDRAAEATSRATALEAENNDLIAERDALADEVQALKEAQAAQAAESRKEKALAAVEAAFGDDAPQFYVTAAETAAQSEGYDHDTFKAMVDEAAGHQASEAGTPNLGGGTATETITESKVTDTDIVAVLEGK